MIKLLDKRCFKTRFSLRSKLVEKRSVSSVVVKRVLTAVNGLSPHVDSSDMGSRMLRSSYKSDGMPKGISLWILNI